MMKKWIYILTAALLTTGCGDFLEEVSNDQIVPKSAKDYREFLFGEIYDKQNKAQIAHWLDIMTDDCEEFAKKASFGTDTRTSGFGYYCWQSDPELQQNGVRVSDVAWSTYYHQILICNMVLYDIDKMIGSEAEKAQVRAEAHMARAYAYWMLVNLYADPYNPATAKTALGVPINDLVGAEKRNFPRATMAEVYGRITDDLTAAIEQFGHSGGGESLFRWNLSAAYVFASRVYLYLQNWSEAERYATAAITRAPKLWNLNEKNSAGAESAGIQFLSAQNPEILFTFGYYYINWFATGAKGAYPVSTNLKAIYASGDLRYGASNGAFIRNQGSSFMGGGKRYLQYKNTETSTTSRHGQCIRTAEAYLNRAEARANQPTQLAQAAEDLNTLRRNRFTPAAYTELTYTDQADLIEKVQVERRRELCFERQRWFDLRRWGRPRIEHVYTPNFSALTEKVTYVLEENDPAYTLPVPYSVLEQDPMTSNINRPERKPVTANE